MALFKNSAPWVWALVLALNFGCSKTNYIYRPSQTPHQDRTLCPGAPVVLSDSEHVDSEANSHSEILCVQVLGISKTKLGSQKMALVRYLFNNRSKQPWKLKKLDQKLIATLEGSQSSQILDPFLSEKEATEEFFDVQPGPTQSKDFYFLLPDSIQGPEDLNDLTIAGEVKTRQKNLPFSRTFVRTVASPDTATGIPLIWDVHHENSLGHGGWVTDEKPYKAIRPVQRK